MALADPFVVPALTEQGYELVSRRLVLPEDCHDMDGLYGGRLMEWMDQAGSIYCRYAMGMSRVLTRHIENWDFAASASTGETVAIYCKLTATGSSSLHMDITATVLSYDRKDNRILTTLHSTWVGVDENGNPFPWDKQFTGSISTHK